MHRVFKMKEKVKAYLMIYEGRKLLVEALTAAGALKEANDHFAPFGGTWVETENLTFEWINLGVVH